MFTRRIAAIVEDPLVRARHLALSKDPPDAEVADVLEDAARLAADRGASAVAAELAEHALRLTPPDESDERHRRALAAARAHQAAGEWTRARTIATDLLAETEIGPVRAEALVLLAELERDRRPSRCSRQRCARRSRARRSSRSSIAASPGRRASGQGSSHRARAALELAERARRRRAPSARPLASRRSSAGSPATPRRRHDLPARARDLPAPSAASSWCRRRRWRS